MDYLLPDLNCARKRTSKEVNRRDFVIDKNYINIGKNLKYHIITHGCLANERDSELIAGILEKISYVYTDNVDDADLVIINTCAIRQGAEEKVFGQLGALKKNVNEKKNMIVGLCGCMAQEESTVKRILDKYKHVNLVFGTHNIVDLPILINNALNKIKTVSVKSIEGEVIENIPDVRKMSHKANVNIMYGCDKFCSYCIVPYTRGKERSRRLEDVLLEVNKLINDGYKEITLLGQNVNAYGKDLNLGYDFSNLLEEVAKSGIKRIRFMTSHPWDFNDSMISIIKKYSNIMPYIHLPLQSGSDKVLKKMNRRYDQKTYLELFDKLKNNLPNFAFTTDIIVGFPFEDDEDFNETLKVVDYCKFDNAFTFIFSPREGTPAYNMVNTLSEEIKTKRLNTLNEKVAYYANLNNEKFLDKVVEVLVDGYSKKDDSVLSGYCPEGKIVNFIGDAKVGDIVNVKITKTNSFSLFGVIV